MQKSTIVKLKVTENNIVKRIPVPDTYEQLTAQASALNQNRAVTITYIDADGDNVEVMDQSDLVLAMQGRNAITFQVSNAGVPKMQPQPVSQPVVEEVINTASKPSEEEEKVGVKKGKKPGCGKGMNRKALKNLIQQELEKQSKSIFQEILKQPIDGIEETKDPQDENATHQGVKCDGCETVPITGIRYKCAVCKDFDYCANCEERLAHEHPFLKIKNPANVPDVMITILPEMFGEAEGQSKPQGEQQHPFQFAGPRGRCGRGGKGGPGPFKRMIGQFLEQMGLNMEDVTKKMQEGGKGCGWNKQAWKCKRAEIVECPESILEGNPGEILLPSITLKNNTAWPWKQGCFLTLANEAGEGIENLPIEMVKVDVDQQVMGQGTIKLTVPLKIRDDAIAGETVHEIKLAMRGPGGCQFGQLVTLHLQINRPNDFQDEIQIYKLAMKLAEQGLASFDDCVAAVKNNNFDETAAINALKQRKH